MIFAFGPFRLDAEAQTLFRGAEPLPIGKRAVALLRVLVEHPGALVTKDALIERVWPGLAVEESNLTVQIVALRRVLGGEPGGENWIQTLPRRGYRFLGPPVTASQTLARAEALLQPPSAALALQDKPSIAVLPFDNLSGDPEQEYFADGMVEDIITALSRMRWLFVIARGSSFTYKGRAPDVKQVARELGVRYVLEGSVRKAASRVRISGQLIDGATGVHLWADRFEGALEDIFDLQDQVTASVVGAIGSKLEQAEIERARVKPTESLNAYDLYLRALPSYYALARTDEALQLLRQAINLDPNYGLAKARAAHCIAMRDDQGISLTKSETDEGIRLAREALDAGRDDPSVLELAGWAFAYLTLDLEAGFAALDRALVLNSNSFQALTLSGWLRLCSGDPRTATEHFTRAIRLSPLDPGISQNFARLGVAQMMTGNYEEAVKFGRQAIRELPRNVVAHRVVAASLALLGRADEAAGAMRALLAVAPNFTMSQMRGFVPYRDAEFVERYLRGLREAGLPE
jgi:TolB-like protein/Flp pilus assembly protein TadD